MKKVYLLGGVLFYLCLGCSQSSSECPEKVNILMILVDDLGYTDLGYTGSSYYETPHIDALASQGVTFSRGYTACAVCSPSRASIMTGQFVTGHGITDWIGAGKGEQWRKMNRHDKLLPADYVEALPQEATTLPEVLKEVGYRTFFAGKWHLGELGSSPEDHGFDVNIGGGGNGSPLGGFFSPFNNARLEDKEAGEHLSMRLSKETLQYMRDNQDVPVFAFLSFYAVHCPVQTNQKYWEKYRDKAEKRGIADHGFRMGEVLPERMFQDNPVYAGLVQQMDDAVGYILEGLKESGLDKNTIVVFTSDNGGVISGDDYATNLAPLKGGKGQAYEGGIRVPFIIYVPWLDQVVATVDLPVMSIDIYPTLLSLIGRQGEVNQVLDGVDLSLTLVGEKLAPRPLFWHYPHYGNQGGKPHSIIMEGDWKLIYFWEKGESELYHVSEDIGECNDLALVERQRTRAMQERLMQWLDKTQAKRPVADPQYDEQKQLEVLKRYRENRLPTLENMRHKMLSPTWKPNANWWGSTID